MRERRARFGLSGRDVGLMVNVDSQQIWRWERADVGIAAKNLQSLYKNGMLPLGALTGLAVDMNTYKCEPKKPGAA